MKINTIIIVLTATMLGLGMGYFLFGKSNTSKEHSEQHNHSHKDNSEAQIWTCSMHPQIRQPESGLCPICEMDLIPLEANTSNDPLVLEMTEASVKLANIQTTPITIGVGENSESENAVIRLSGKVQSDERLASSQVAHLAGRIERLYVSFKGEQVKKGQKLAEIYAPELITAQRELLEAKKLVNLNPDLLEAARNKLKYWKIGTETIKTIEESGEIQEIFPLYAQASGIVMERKVAVGDYVQQGEVLFDLMNLSKVWVLFDAYEENLSNIKIGDQIEFTTSALPNQIFKSRVTFIDLIINPNTRTASIRTEVKNTNRQLKPEMLVYGQLTSKSSNNTQLTVPKTAVLWTGKRSVVYIKVPDTKIPSFQYREIEIGDAVGSNYQIINGLEVGEEVVTYGSFTIDAAAQLNNQASMMNQAINIKGEDTNVVPDFRASTPETFQKYLTDLATAYVEVKNALVATDASATTETANQLLYQVKVKIGNKNLLKGDAYHYWMKQHNVIFDYTTMMTKTTEIEEQRQYFELLSQALIKAIETFGIIGETLYVQHCPMASDNEGADWLAKEESIRNPYFGDKMMNCGWVKEILDGNAD